MQVLIVDSSVQIARRLEEMLSEVNSITAVYTSVSYEDAILLFIENRPDVVLLCTGLPENKSIELLREMKTAVYRTTVVVLSVNTDEYLHEQCRLLGADCLLDKYLDFEKIPDVIDDISDINNIIH